MDRSKLLVVVDMQNDFITGPLGTPEAQELVEKVCDRTDHWDGYVVFTMDTRYEGYLDTLEGAHNPVEHCIDGTDGWHLNDEVKKRQTDKTFTVYKDGLGAVDLADIIRILEIKTVEFVGTRTDISVLSSAIALRSMMPDVNISVDATCCAGTTPQSHVLALAIMRQNTIDIIT